MTETPQHPPLKLTAQQKQQLESLSEEVKHWQSEIDRAKRIGIDTSALQKQLDQAEELRKLVLSEYS